MSSAAQRQRKSTRSDANSTREILLASGLRSFGERGYSASRLSDIVEEAGLTTGAFYRHFTSKSEFFQELRTGYEEDLQFSLGATRSLRGKFEVWLRVARRHRGVIRGLMEMAGDGGPETAMRERLRQGCASLLFPHLLDGTQWRDATTAALMLVDVLDQYALMEATGWAPERSAQSVAVQLHRLVKTGLYRQ